METLFDFDQLDPKQLNLHQGELTMYKINYYVNLYPEMSTEVMSWLINPPPIYAAKETDSMKKRMEAHAKVYMENKASSIRLVERIKREVYDYLCTKSKTYKAERDKMNGNINNIITGLSGTIATSLGGVEFGIVATIVTTILLTIYKMGKRVACSYLSPAE